MLSKRKEMKMELISWFAILDVLKMMMYDYHYNVMQKHYGDNIKLMYTDTVEPKIRKEDTKFRKAIPSNERLALTLRYLASGDSFASLSLVFKISKLSISHIIPEVCTAIIEVLQDYIQAINNIINTLTAMCTPAVTLSINLLLFLWSPAVKLPYNIHATWTRAAIFLHIFICEFVLWRSMNSVYYYIMA
ncbi:hypothetical protein QTP88_021231 [Uroleucon formosanum]